jgi:hypothetical protein
MDCIPRAPAKSAPRLAPAPSLSMIVLALDFSLGDLDLHSSTMKMQEQDEV